MGRFGIHSGRIDGKSVQADNRYVSNRQVLWADDLMGEDSRTGVAMTQVLGAKASAYYSLSGVLGTSGVETPTWNFDTTADSAVAFNLMVPTGLPENARADLRVFWTTSGATGAKWMSGVAWDIDYRSVNIVLSGQNAHIDLQLSGSVSNATGTGTWVMTRDSVSAGQAGVMSGIITHTVVTIPSTGFRVGNLIQCVLYRDSAEALDDLLLPAHVVAVAVEYV